MFLGTNEIYYKEIDKLMAGKTNPDVIHDLLSVKFGIRNGFECSSLGDFVDGIKKQKQIAKKLKYQYITSDKIYKEVIKLLK